MPALFAYKTGGEGNPQRLPAAMEKKTHPIRSIYFPHDSTRFQSHFNHNLAVKLPPLLVARLACFPVSGHVNWIGVNLRLWSLWRSQMAAKPMRQPGSDPRDKAQF
jgi:hypothetical protein